MTATYFPHRLAADVTIGEIPTFDYPKALTQFRSYLDASQSAQHCIGMDHVYSCILKALNLPRDHNQSISPISCVIRPRSRLYVVGSSRAARILTPTSINYIAPYASSLASAIAQPRFAANDNELFQHTDGVQL